MTEFPKPRIVISKCIGFDPCRYNGEIVQDKFVARLAPHVEFVAVCPEVEIGLGAPREPVRVVSSANTFTMIQPATGLDLTDKMRSFTGAFLNSVGEVDGFILKSRSPSCGIGDVKFYAGPEKSSPLGKTAGLFGGAALERFDDRAIEDEGRLRNLALREHFLTRIFAFARLRRLQGSGAMKDLVGFQAANKLLLMAYSQAKMRELGRIVANAERKRRDSLFAKYGICFRQALRKPPKPTSPINVLMHALGYFKQELSQREKKHFLETLDAYRCGRTPLSSAVSILNSWIARFDSDYLREQTFFRPFPEHLMALDDSGKGRAFEA